MRIVIAGCGRVGSDLAVTLSEEGHDVSVIDNRDGVFRDLGKSFNGTTHPGVAYDIRVLRDAGIEFADAFVAVTDSDNANLMAVQLAKQVFSVPETIARLEDANREESYRALKIDYVAGARLISQVIREQLLHREFRYHVTFSSGDVEISDIRMGPVPEGFTVADLEVSGLLRVAAVQRNDRTHVPEADFAIHEGDLVVASTKPAARDEIERYLAKEKPQ